MSLKKTPRMMPVPAAQMDWLGDLPAQCLSAAQTVQWLNLWTGQGLLRHIDSAFAAQVLRLDAEASAPLLVASAAMPVMLVVWRAALRQASVNGPMPSVML